MALLAIVACAAVVPVFHVETAGEADVLVSKIFHDVRKLGVSNASNTVGRAAGNVWNDVRSDYRGGIATTRRIATTTTTTGAIAATAIPRLVALRGPLLSLTEDGDPVKRLPVVSSRESRTEYLIPRPAFFFSCQSIGRTTTSAGDQQRRRQSPEVPVSSASQINQVQFGCHF